VGPPTLAILELSDYLTLSLIVLVSVGAAAAARSAFRPSDAARLRRLEAKVDLILHHLGLEYTEPTPDGLSPEVKALADDPSTKIRAIALHREQTGAGLKEAKDAVEAYIAGRG
jgi:ribosomal protein L7/L12